MKRLGRFLAYIERGKKYVAIANSALIFIIFLQTTNIEMKPIYYILLPVAAIIMYVVIGFVDTSLGLRRMENYDNEKNNPIRMKTYKNTKEILKKMK